MWQDNNGARYANSMSICVDRRNPTDVTSEDEIITYCYLLEVRSVISI